jgi:subtilisin family serine protease
MVINGLAVSAPQSLIGDIGKIAHLDEIERSGSFDRPSLPFQEDFIPKKQKQAGAKLRTSVEFFGAEAAHQRGLRGKGMSVGIIDTGIDFTHAMFGGAGTAQAFKAIDPSQPTSSFPNGKVVGGVDFVGTEYNSGSVNFRLRIPKMDANPIDEGGHGSHVAGTVAGIGDGVNTYDGVAPEADLHALKVFGANGSTMDAVVIAALEYAADPNSDGDLGDQLDVVNLSLGSGYGSDHILYSEAIRNLSNGGTAVVAAAGNNGDLPYIVGSPSATDEALSVAAMVDEMEQNWKFRSIQISMQGQAAIHTEAIEGSFTKPLKVAADEGPIVAELVYAGLAAEDFSDELNSKLAGKIAFIDRGQVGFAEKVGRAFKAGSIGVIVANNQPGAPTTMGGAGTKDEPYSIPAVMISLELANQIKAAQETAPVIADMTSPHMIEKPELIGTMATFSSKGPRSIDGHFKPEISAPGSKIISAKFGAGALGTQTSGTSMAAPHVAGAVALLKQAHSSLNSDELKSLVLSSAQTLQLLSSAQTLKPYPLSRQGAGLIQIEGALNASLVTVPASISIGEMTLESQKTVLKKVVVRNISSETKTLSTSLNGATPGLTLASVQPITLPPGESRTLDLRLSVAFANLPKDTAEVSGYVTLSDESGHTHNVPVLAVIKTVSQLRATGLLVRSTSNTNSFGAVADLTLQNRGLHEGEAYPFNLIARSPRKEDPTLDPFRSKICDLAASGYRLIDKKGVPTLQIAVKIYEPMTTWDLCEISVLIDSDGDHEPDQELAGLRQNGLPPLTSREYASLLIDAKMAKKIRKAYETAVLTRDPESKEPAPTLSFLPALEALAPMLAFENSTVSILETPVSALRLKPNGTLAIRIATSAQTGSAIEPDDFLSKDPKKWHKLDIAKMGQSFVDLPEVVRVPSNSEAEISFTKGHGSSSLLLLYPSGKPVTGSSAQDHQSQVLSPKFNP